jgi:hypothetical protein
MSPRFDELLLSRRRFLHRSALLAATGALGNSLPGPWTDEAMAAPEQLLPWVADVSGEGSWAKQDEKIIRRALRTRRGLDLTPRGDYDYRADVFGSGRVDRAALKSVRATRRALADDPTLQRARPITVAWHYGWYNFESRRPRQHHVWFKGGGYSSRSPQAEALFNDLKNEFGITVDALSWADPKVDDNLNQNLELGYLNAPNARTRYAALLYESLLSLRANPGDRIDFARNVTRKRLVEHFRGMARFFNKLRDQSKARIFELDGRPVIFIYASHTWGTNVDGNGEQYDRIDQAMETAIANFENIHGKAPFIVGEETTFAETDVFDLGRQRRAANFDAVFSYHHASNGDFIVRGGQHLRGDYVDQVKQVVGNLYAGALEHKSRFTGKQTLVIPSLAAGFSKVGVPTLYANRAEYADFLKEMLRFHHDEYMVNAFGEGPARRTPAIVSVGSWNEEWEGHAVFPSQFNRTLSPRTQKGFDYVMAIKQACGWNHYMRRDGSISL